MEIFRELSTIKNTCVGLGFFDGVHSGHQALIKKLVDISKENNKKSVVITFKENPAEKFSKEKITYLTTTDEKEKLMSAFNTDYLFELDFTDEIMKMSAEEYIEKILYKHFSPDYLISGFNHTFGKDRSGTPEVLRKHQDKYNYKYIEMPEITKDGKTVSSTLIKKELSLGNIKEANELLGYNYTIFGTVIKGNQIGKTIGFPTANIEYPKNKAQIPFGVYSAKVKLKNKTYNGMLNYGIKPTINKDCKPVAEVHIIGFNRDIYGEKTEIEILDKIRDEKKFNSLDELKQQITKDIEKC